MATEELVSPRSLPTQAEGSKYQWPTENRNAKTLGQEKARLPGSGFGVHQLHMQMEAQHQQRCPLRARGTSSAMCKTKDPEHIPR